MKEKKIELSDYKLPELEQSFMNIMEGHERLVELPFGYKKMLAREFASMIHENYVEKEAMYPEEFVEWIGADCSPVYLQEKDEDNSTPYKWIIYDRSSIKHSDEFDTLSRLYQYWLDNIKNK